MEDSQEENSKKYISKSEALKDLIGAFAIKEIAALDILLHPMNYQSKTKEDELSNQ